MYDKNTKIFGITGYPLGHTLSPLIHNTLYQTFGNNNVYLVFEKEKPDLDFINSLRSLGVRGLSVTIPHKEWAYEIAENHDPISSVMQASNTLLFRGQTIESFNTDGPGALQAILSHCGEKIRQKESGDILLLGSGGSARGIAFSLLPQIPAEKKILVSSRNEKTAGEIVEKLNSLRKNSSKFIPLQIADTVSARTLLVIQTTPVGMKAMQDTLLLPASFFTKEHFLFDIVYNPLQTSLVKAARQAGAYIIPGYEMLLYQAMLQYEIFTGKSGNAAIPNIKDLLVRKLS